VDSLKAANSPDCRLRCYRSDIGAPSSAFIPQAAVQSLELFNMVVLGIIGFLVGSELKCEIFIKSDKQIPIVLVFEGLSAITLEGIRNIFVAEELSDWLVALDIAEPVVDIVTPDTALSEAVELMEHNKIEYVPVVVSQQSREYAGVLDSRVMHRQLDAEVLY